VSTKGVWYPDRTKATERDPPLYLHITANTHEMLQSAIDKVNELIAIDLGPLVEDKKDRLREKASMNAVRSFVCLADSAHVSENGQRRRYRLVLRAFGISTFAPRWWAHL
jgi:hypothetical protein